MNAAAVEVAARGRPVRGLGPRLLAVARRSPASVVLAVVLLVVAIADGSFVRVPALVQLAPASAHRHPLEVFGLWSGIFVSRSAPDLLLGLAALLLVLVPVERVMGTAWTVLAYTVTSLVGVTVGLGLQSLGVLTHAFWTTPDDGAPAAGPLTPVVGAVLAASAFTGPLWRRRIRLLGLSGSVVVLLYSGQPNDLYRLLAALAGLVLGLLLAQRRPVLTWPRSSHHEVRSLLASLVAVGALGPFVALLAPRGYGLLRPLGMLFRDPLPPIGGLRAACRVLHPDPSCVRDIALTRLNGPGAVLLTILPLVVLLIASLGMWRGRRLAALVAVGVNGLLAVLAGIYYGFLPAVLDPDQLLTRSGSAGPDLQTILAVGVPAGVAVAVLVMLRHFDVLPTRRAAVGFAVAVGGVLVGTAVLYLGVGLALAAQFQPHVGLTDLLGAVPERYVPVGFLRLRRLDFVPATAPAQWLSDLTGPIAWLALLVALVAAGLSRRGAQSAGQLERLRAVLRQGSAGSLGHMALWSGNRIWLAPDGAHAVAYREVNGVALAIGEPAGPATGSAEAAQAFALFCDDAGLTPVFYAVRPGFADGLDGEWPSLLIGEDTILDPATFTMKGKRWQDVRSSFNRADRAGVRVVETSWDRCSLTRRSQIIAISEEWVAERRLPELGFTLGGLDELKDAEVRLLLAVGPDDRIEAVTSWLPTYREGRVVGWTLDFMRRRPDGMNGVMEFLIASAVLRAKEEDAEFVSLSVAPLAASGSPGEELPRALDTLARILEPAYGFRSLAAFKEKFQPELRPVVLAYPDPIALPVIGVALARAYLPDMSLPGVARLAGALR